MVFASVSSSSPLLVYSSPHLAKPFSVVRNAKKSVFQSKICEYCKLRWFFINLIWKFLFSRGEIIIFSCCGIIFLHCEIIFLRCWVIFSRCGNIFLRCGVIFSRCGNIFLHCDFQLLRLDFILARRKVILLRLKVTFSWLRNIFYLPENKSTAYNSVFVQCGVNIFFENSVNNIRKMLFIFLFLVI